MQLPFPSHTERLNKSELSIVHCKAHAQLRQLTWDYHGQTMHPEMALSYYERRWRYLDPPLFSLEERTLLNSLVIHYGKGYFLPC